ncbi:MAG: KH domain-containing protein [Candidatus Krumholzibacteriia bacterium]
MTDVQGLLALLAVNLADHPQEVGLQRLDQPGVEVYRLSLHPDDRGRIIGRGGQTARALRAFLLAAGARADRRVGLEIAE